MAIVKNDEYRKALRDSYISQIKAIGESLILHAEDLIGELPNITSFYISFDLDPEIERPEINISTSYIPDTYPKEK